MIPKEKKLKLIGLYMYICDIYKSSLRFYCQRFSNNSNPEFTDEEVLTVYLFCGYCQRYFGIKEIYTFAKEYLLSWFPKLPSYQTFNTRLNMLSEAFKVLVATMIQSFKPKDCDSIISIVDSMPIVTCKGKNREGKVATEITSKGYCSTKNMYYYGLKLHMVGQRREGAIPFPEIVVLSSAAENDLTVSKTNVCHILPERPFLQTRFTATSLSLVIAIRLKYLLHIRRLRESRKSSDKGKRLPETCSQKQYQKSDNL